MEIILSINTVQTTITRPVICYGIGVHSGKKTQLTMKPAPADTGIVFIRSDVTSVTNVIQASYNMVSDTMLSTTVKNDANIAISTIEHVMAALWGYGIDNVIIEVDGPEVPILDGSSAPFLFLIECAGIKTVNSPRKVIKILREVEIMHKDAHIVASPSDIFSINMEIDFQSKAIGRQSMICLDQSMFRDEIASARTFGFMHEVEYLKNKGLAQGASLENAIGIDKDEVLNPEGLRFENEFARHKLLDAVGDFYTAGCHIIGKFHCSKSGHHTDNELLRAIFSDSNNYQLL